MNRVQLGKICDIVMGQSPQGSSYNEVGDGIPLINGPTEFTEKYPIKRQWTSKPTKLCKRNDILICVRGSSTGRMNISDGEYCIGRGVAAISGKDRIALTDYIYYLLDFEINNILLKSSGSTFPNVTSKELNELFVILFDKNSQEQIVKILKNWDRTIELNEKLLQEKQKQKKGLMERLLTGKVRLSGFDQKWNELKLEEILESRNEKSEVTNNLELFSLTIEDGVTPKTDRYNREFLVKEDNKKYKIAKYNDIVYNPANLRFGAITLNKVEKDVLLSPIYEILYIKDNTKYDIDFIGAILTTDSQIKKFSTMAEGTLVERMSVKVKDFINFKIRIPNCIEEQKAIAKIINTSQKEIDLIKKEIELLKEQKKGLMQLLLTGIVRVKCD